MVDRTPKSGKRGENMLSQCDHAAKSDTQSMSEIDRRKREHLDVILSGAATPAGATTGLEHVRFEHNALPELKMADIDLSTSFLGRSFRAPLLVSSMTGGPERSAQLNLNIAEACNALGLGFGVGSQRIALEGGGDAGFGPELRRAAPNALILANFGAGQLKSWNGPDMARRAVEMIGADALIIHLNPLQEAVQAMGDTDWSGVCKALAKISQQCDFPIIVKEVGAGISAPVAKRLLETGVAAIDIAGLGGTSWSAVEAARAPTTHQRVVAEAFRDWGIPTAQALMAVRAACPAIPLIASGGIRTGIDCAKTIRLGADLTGVAAGVLPSAVESADAISDYLSTLIDQLRITCFCTGSANLAALRQAPLINLQMPA